MSKIQSLLFDRKYFDTKKAELWMKRNNFKSIKKVDITKNFLRFRQKNPNLFKNFRIIELNGNKVKAVLGF